MACSKYNDCGFRCGGCCHFVYTSAVTVVGNVLVLNIPQKVYSNREKACICIRQSIPSTVTSAMTVAITIGTSATQYPLRTRCGNNVHADQVRSRRVYHTDVATDTAAFYTDRCKLCPTGFNFPTIPAVVAEEPAETT